MGGRGVLLGAVVLFVAACGMAGAATITIDDFSHGGFSMAAYADGSTATIQQPVAGVLGGMRHAGLGVPPGALQIEGLDNVRFSVFPFAGVADYESSVGATGFATLRYYNNDQFIGDLSGALFIQIDFALVDLGLGGPMDVLVALQDGAANAAMLSQTVTTATPQSLIFPFAAFSGIASLNLADLHEISILFEPGQAADFRVAQIIADVPEPAPLLLLGVGTLSALWRRTR